MARTIVNKHFDKRNNVTREQFHDNPTYAKGELIIVNDEKPTIYVLNNELIPMPLAVENNGGGGITPEEVEAIKSEITEKYTAADNALRGEMQKANEELQETISGVNDEFKNEFNEKLKGVESAYLVEDYKIRGQIAETKAEMLRHTVNGIAISENPVLDASHVGVGNYTEIVLNDTPEYVITNDAVQIALKKIENMAIANAIAFSAALNNLNGRLEEALKRIDELEGNTSEE